jgi:2-oxoglutarate dehydrogenase E2 component (dihydrolipoamide succinyltransferase)
MAEGGLIDLVAPLEEEGAKAVVLTWLKAVGDAVARDEPVVELETDKVAVEVAAPAAGILAELLLPAEAEATYGAVLGRIRTGEAAPMARQAAAPPAPPARPAPRPVDDRELRLSPSVRRLARESGVDPRGVAGTGRGGRLTRADMAGAIARRQEAPEGGASRRAPHDRMRRQIAEHLSRSVSVAPHVTAVFEADFTAVLAHREARKAAFAAAGAPLTLTAYIVAAAARAMAAAPAVNSRWHDDYLEIFADVNIGIGTALGDKGLVVPVIRAAQGLTLEDIAARLNDLTKRARAGRLAAADVRGGTFSISNHGVSGSLLAAPIIINQPQSAILGVGKLQKRVVVREAGGAEAIQIRPMAYVSLTIDHRVIDAAQTNAWLARFVAELGGWPVA